VLRRRGCIYPLGLCTPNNGFFLDYYIDAYSTAKFLFEKASYPVPEIEILSHNGK
jgi:hypothetical protein